MTFTKTLTAAMAALTLAAGTLTPLASANARDFDRRGASHGWQGDRDHGRNYDRQVRRGDRYGSRQRHGYRKSHRDHNGRNVAIGAFAAIVGLAIAAEANRNRGYDY